MAPHVARKAKARFARPTGSPAFPRSCAIRLVSGTNQPASIAFTVPAVPRSRMRGKSAKTASQGGRK